MGNKKEIKYDITGNVGGFAAAAREAVAETNRMAAATRAQADEARVLESLQAKLAVVQARRREAEFKAKPVGEQINIRETQRAAAVRESQDPANQSASAKLASQIIVESLDFEIAKLKEVEEANRRANLARDAKRAATEILARDAATEAEALHRQEAARSRISARARELLQLRGQEQALAFARLTPEQQLEQLEQRRERLLRMIQQSEGNALRTARLRVDLANTQNAITARQPKGGFAADLKQSVFGQFTAATVASRLVFAAMGEARELLADAQKIQAGSGRLGVSKETFQGFQAGAKKTEIGDEEVFASFKSLRVAQARALAGNKELTQAFGFFGVSIEDLKTKNAEQLFRQIGARAENTAQSSGELEEGMKVLGRTAERVLPALRDGFFEAADAAAKLSNNLVDGLADAGDRLEQAGQNLKVSFAGPLVWVMDRLSEMVDLARILAVWLMVIPKLDEVLTGRLDVNGLKKEIDRIFEESMKPIDQRIALARDREKPSKTEDPEKEAARIEGAEEKRIREQIAKLQEEMLVEQMTKEEKINYLLAQRATLAEKIAKAKALPTNTGPAAPAPEGSLTATEKAKADLELLKLDRELAQLRDADDAARPARPASGPGADQLARIGGFRGGGGDQALSLARQQVAETRNLGRKMDKVVNNTQGLA